MWGRLVVSFIVVEIVCVVFNVGMMFFIFVVVLIVLSVVLLLYEEYLIWLIFF